MYIANNNYLIEITNKKYYNIHPGGAVGEGYYEYLFFK